MDEMDPLLNLLDQRPRKDWNWAFDPAAEGESAVNAVALCNAAILTYSAQPEVRSYLANWKFDDIRILRGFSTQGFVARQGNLVVVAFRGTEPIKVDDWLSDVNYHQVKFRDISGTVHGGFANAFQEIAAPLLAAVQELASTPDAQVYVTGHSLGGALAILAAASLHFSAGVKIAGVSTFGQPRVGDPVFSREFDQALRHKTFRYVNDIDIVPHVPPADLPGRLELRLPASVLNLRSMLKQVADDVRVNVETLIRGEKFAHVGQLRLFLPDGAVSSDEIEWQSREVLYSGTLTTLMKTLPQLLRTQLRALLTAHDRIGHHDPCRGYIPRLEKQL